MVLVLVANGDGGLFGLNQSYKAAVFLCSCNRYSLNVKLPFSSLNMCGQKIQYHNILAFV